MCDSVIDVLTVFGGMTYKFKHPDGSIETFHFSPEETVGNYYEKVDFEEFEARINEPFVVVGEAFRGYLIMFIAQSDRCLVKMQAHYINSATIFLKH
ncbi:hypothetical protein [Lysinibacillus sp. NPDC056232]|uniref:hypothetical protein n=1 Tax=Lysinibacillus sp. NPDC056232 TaxID=3345756 RepID=UPI0035DA0BF1